LLFTFRSDRFYNSKKFPIHTDLEDNTLAATMIDLWSLFAHANLSESIWPFYVPETELSMSLSVPKSMVCYCETQQNKTETKHKTKQIS
jgi:hypothetical protein